MNLISASLTTLLDQLVELHMTETGPDRLVREAAQGHTDVVKDIILKFPDKVSDLTTRDMKYRSYKRRLNMSLI